MSFSPDHPPDALCVIRLSAIGDCCHTVPVLRTIQSAWPGTSITWVIGATEYRLFDAMEGIEFITFDKPRSVASLVEIRRRLAARRFPILLHMHASMRANLASRMVRADTRLGFDRARARDYQWLFTNARIEARPERHVMDGLFEFAQYFGIAERELRWDIPLDDADREFAAQICDGAETICVISPCSSQRFRNYRNWRDAHYAAVADYLDTQYAARVILTGGATQLERDYGRRIAALARAPVHDFIGRTTLKQLLALLERAKLLICPDSGPAHMATAVGTPVIGLYATSNRHRTGPYYSQHLVVDKYPEAVRREFAKEPEQLRWGERVRSPEAMNLIGVDDVIAKIDLAFGAPSESTEFVNAR